MKRSFSLSLSLQAFRLFDDDGSGKISLKVRKHVTGRPTISYTPHPHVHSVCMTTEHEEGGA